jgi:ubiquinone/menaquinone biosynthesis C-methylase UbiE
MPPRRVRWIGRSLAFLVARAPWLWPLMRRPVTRFWNRMAARWGQRMSPGRVSAVEEALGRVGDPRRILEVGSGTGAGAQVLRKRFPDADITGADISEAMVKLARENVPSVDFEVADAGSLPFADDAFDLVMQLNVPVYFGELARVTAPGGCIVIASSLGPATPYYTPHSLLRKRFQKLGLEVRAAEAAPPGDFFIACRPS